MSDDIAISAKNVSKNFRLPHERADSVKSLFVNPFNKKRKKYEVQHALRDISFDVKKGEFFGIVGRNGSGKSTLLKIIAGIYQPNKGDVTVNGRLVPFIELGVGFNPELTGRENTYLNGALLGFSEKEVDDKYDDIVNFAELDRFMDQKLKNYSSGMQVRLAFSIAIRANTPILLIDEVLAVGDSEFQGKCYAEFRKMKEEGRTIVFVTHDMSAVEKFCDRVLVLKSGKITGVYKPNRAAAIYQRMNISISNKQDSPPSNSKRWGTGDVNVVKVDIHDGENKTSIENIVNQGNEITFNIKLKNKDKPKSIVAGLAFKDIYGVNLSGPNSQKFSLNSSSEVVYKIPQLSFVPGVYILTVVIFDKNTEVEYDHIEEATRFTVVNDGKGQYGKITLFGKWSQS